MKFIALLGAFLLHEAYTAECVASNIPEPTFRDDVLGQSMATSSSRVVMGSVGKVPMISKGGCAACGDMRVRANGVAIKANGQGAIVYGPDFMRRGTIVRCSGPGCNNGGLSVTQSVTGGQSTYQTVQTSQNGLSEYSSNGIMSGHSGMGSGAQTISYTTMDDRSNGYSGVGGVYITGSDGSQSSGSAVQQNVVLVDGASDAMIQGGSASGQYTESAQYGGATQYGYGSGAQQNLSAQKQARLRQQVQAVADPSQLVQVTTTTLPGMTAGIAKTTTTTQSVVNGAEVVQPQVDYSGSASGISSGGSSSYTSGSYTNDSYTSPAPQVVAPDDRPAEVQNVINIPLDADKTTSTSMNGIIHGSSGSGTLSSGGAMSAGAMNGALSTSGSTSSSSSYQSSSSTIGTSGSTTMSSSSYQGSVSVTNGASGTSGSTTSSTSQSGAVELPSDVYVIGKTTPSTAYVSSSSVGGSRVGSVEFVGTTGTTGSAGTTSSMTTTTTSSSTTIPAVTVTKFQVPSSSQTVQYQDVQNVANTAQTTNYAPTSTITSSGSSGSFTTGSSNTQTGSSIVSSATNSNIGITGSSTITNGASGVSVTGSVPIVNRPDSNIQVVTQHINAAETKVSTGKITVPDVKIVNTAVQDVRQPEPVTITPTASTSQVVIPRADIIKDERAIKPGCNAAQTLEAPGHRVDKFDVQASQKNVADFTIEMKERKQAQIVNENKQAAQARYVNNVNGLQQAKQQANSRQKMTVQSLSAMADEQEKRLAAIKMKKVQLPTVETKYNAPQFYKARAATITQYSMPARKTTTQPYIFNEQVCGGLNCPKIQYVKKNN